MTDQARFPEVARELLQRAVLAPSSHNTQPWRFVIEADRIDLHLDRSRHLPVADPDDRELVISCGCALLNLRLAAAARGHALAVDTFPDPARPGWLARIAPATAAPPAREEVELAGEIEARHTHRDGFLGFPIARPIVRRLVAAAALEGASLHPITGHEDRETVAHLVAEGDRLLWAEPRWRRELATWMHPSDNGDGLPVPAPIAPLARLVVRLLDLGDQVAHRDGTSALDAPLLAILATHDDTPAAWLAAGQALERVLLVAGHHGLQASFLNQPIQVAALRPRLVPFTGGAEPQVMVRIGYPSQPPAATPRRELDDVLASDP